MHLKLEGVPAGRTYRDNTLMQWLMQHGLWFHQVHRSSWLLPWHRQYLYEVERLLLVAWEDIRGDDARLIKYGWPTLPSGGIVSGAHHTDADGVTSFIAPPLQTCVAIPYWYHPRDSGHRPRDVRMAAYDPVTFGGSGLGSKDGCVNASQFGRRTYAVGNWGRPQSKLPNGKAHAGYWGSEGRCLRRPFDAGKRTAFISESRLRQLLRTCSLPWEQWQLIYEREVHDPVHDFTLGHMITPISSHDPLFWLHHAGLDRGWAVWQQLCGRGGDATRRCGTAASPLGYRPLPPDPKLWVQSEDPRWALRHADARTTVYDDCGPRGCEVAGVQQPISFAYRMPPCSDDAGEPREEDECEHSSAGYSHACRARLEPFSSWPASSRRPAAVSSPESMLDLERISHSCTRGRAGTLRCDCVRYAAP